MSCPAAPLLTYYTDKINIYQNDNFIPMPSWVSCPAPSLYMLAPALLTQSDCGTASVTPIPQPVAPITSYRYYPNQPYSGPYSVPSGAAASCATCR